MNENSALDILKSALLLERRGRAFYGQAARNSSGRAVKAFFEMMAAEEDRHIDILSEQYKTCQSQGRFAPFSRPDARPGEVAESVLSADLKDQIAAADFEAAAVSAAIAMEERAVKIYSQRSRDTADEEEKKLYLWLADWEREHLAWLVKIDREITEQIWQDNSFWPF